MFDYLLFSLFTVTFVGGMCAGAVLAQYAAGQTPTINIPSSGIQFAPQQGYIVTIPPAGVKQTEEQQEGSGHDLQEIIVSLAASGAAFVSAKIIGDKKHKENAAEILKGKENTKELARVTYDMNPESAAKINDAPAVQIKTLTNDANAYAEKVAKK